MVRLDFRHLRFLVIEDNAHMRRLLRTILHGFGSRKVFEAEPGPACGAGRMDTSGSTAVEKGFLTGERNFSAPQTRPTRSNARDHVESQEGDHT